MSEPQEVFGGDASGFRVTGADGTHVHVESTDEVVVTVDVMRVTPETVNGNEQFRYERSPSNVSFQSRGAVQLEPFDLGFGRVSRATGSTCLFSLAGKGSLVVTDEARRPGHRSWLVVTMTPRDTPATVPVTVRG